MGQKVSTTNNYTTATVVKGNNNSVVPSSTANNAVSPSQSISPSTTLSLAKKASGDLNPTACAPGKISVSNSWRDFAQSLSSGFSNGLSHIRTTVSALTGLGSSVKESVDNVNAINTGAANNISTKLSDVLRDMSHTEVTKKLRLMSDGASTGFCGGVYNVSNSDLDVEESTALERINSSPNPQGVSPHKIVKRSKEVLSAFTTLRTILELLSSIIGSSFSPSASELNQSFPGMPYDLVSSLGATTSGFNVAPDDEVDPSLSTEIGTFSVEVYVSVISSIDETTSPVINIHATNKITSAIFDSAAMRIIGRSYMAVSLGGARAETYRWQSSYYARILLNRRAVSFSFPEDQTVISSHFVTTVIDTTSLTLNIPSSAVSGMSITAATTGLDLFGYINDVGADTGPGDVRALWHEATIGLASFVRAIQSHPSYHSAVQSIITLLTNYMSDSDDTLESIAIDLLTQVPKYPYNTGPIRKLLDAGINANNVQWIVFCVLNLLDSLATGHVFLTDPAAQNYASRLTALAASRPGSL